MQKVLDNEFVTITVYPEKKIVHHQFHKFIYGDAFRNAMMSAADAFVKNNCTKWLSDDRGNSAVKSEDLAWAKQNWEPKVLKAGWKHWALVLPEKVVGQLSMKQIIADYNALGLNVKTFTDPQSAMGWLEKQ